MNWINLYLYVLYKFKVQDERNLIIYQHITSNTFDSLNSFRVVLILYTGIKHSQAVVSNYSRQAKHIISPCKHFVYHTQSSRISFMIGCAAEMSWHSFVCELKLTPKQLSFVEHSDRQPMSLRSIDVDSNVIKPYVPDTKQ